MLDRLHIPFLFIASIRHSDCFLNAAVDANGSRSVHVRGVSEFRDEIGAANDDESSLLQQTLARGSSSLFDFDSKKTWFKDRDSLPFSCTSCGKCCKVQGDVYLSPLETSAIANYLNRSLHEFKNQFVAQEEIQTGWTMLKNKDDSHGCIFLDEHNMCNIYAVRPLQCVSYPFWPRIMASPQSWNDEVVVPEMDQDVVFNDASRNEVPRRWNLEDGGCEGMKYVDSMQADEIQGVSIRDALAMLDLYSRYDRTFPVDKPFRLINHQD